MQDEEIFTIDEAPGRRFRVHVVDDDTNEAPWERHDGHGPVRHVYSYHSRPEKRPGERVMHSNRGDHWLYDWQAACKLAREDGWNAKPYDAPGQIERAVQADFDYLRRWLSDDWRYIGVCVELLDDEGEPVTERYDYALWGIESDADDYIGEVAKELAGECANAEGITTKQRRAAWLSALHELRESRHWAARDVLTTA
jgi:hypothetical protein